MAMDDCRSVSRPRQARFGRMCCRWVGAVKGLKDLQENVTVKLSPKFEENLVSQEGNEKVQRVEY